MERLSGKRPNRREETPYTAAEHAGLGNKMTSQEHLLGGLFGNAPSLEELRARTPEDMLRIIKKEEQEGKPYQRQMEQLFDAAPGTPTREMVSKALSGLPDQQRMVLNLRYGLEDGVARTLKEVGRAIGRSPSTTLRIKRKALARLRNPQT